MKIFVLFTFLISSLVAQAQRKSSNDIQYNIEPILGFETVYRVTPTPHTSTHTIYGVRLTGGIDLVSGEIEYTKGSDTEKYQTAPETVKYNDEKVKAGLRSIFRLGPVFNIVTRFGGQAKKSTEESTSGTITTTTEKPIKYDPYAGAALGLHLGRFAVNVGVTAVIPDVKDMTKNDYQYAVAIGLGI